MRPLTTWFGLLFALVLAFPARSAAQGTDSVGTRAQGMGGAFVGVADDASAVFWNPAGLAGGSYFSLVLDGNTARAVPDGLNEAATGPAGCWRWPRRRWALPTTGCKRPR